MMRAGLGNLKSARIGLLLAGAASLPLAGCGSTGLSDASAKVASVGDMFSGEPATAPHSVLVFSASTRVADRGAGSQTTVDGPPRLSLLTISVPPRHTSGEVELPSFGAPDPQKHFMLSAQRRLDDESFRNALASHISGRIGSNRDILLYVHGFNTSADEARFRVVQIAQDGQFGGVPMLFTWPSSGSLLEYEAAKESAAVSRDALSKLLLELAAVPGVGRVHILAHSMGTWLAMEALRETAIAGSNDLNGKLGDVLLAAPDIDLNVFRQQLSRVDPSHVSVLVSSGDRALSLSRTLAGDRPRVGALDPKKPADRQALDRLGVKVYDISALSTGLVGHGTYAAAPAVLRTIGANINAPRIEDSGVQSVLGDAPIDPRIDSTPLPPAAAPVAAQP